MHAKLFKYILGLSLALVLMGQMSCSRQNEGTPVPPKPSNAPAAAMVLIPAGSFTMGDTFSEGSPDERPTHEVTVRAFYMDKYEVTKALWDDVYHWATNHGYHFDNRGFGKAANHPVLFVSWYDAVKWCNARSEKEGKNPAYYTSAVHTDVYRSGQIDLENDGVKWEQGYRLPTEAEWEKAARGGVSGKRFPWGDTITHSNANYDSSTNNAYDTSSTRGAHPKFKDGTTIYTSPVGTFAANGYGLYDVVGNVSEWCWDWFRPDYSTTQTDPRGPAKWGPAYRVVRGGFRTASRDQFKPVGISFIGFRTALPPGQ
jgi:formylglycine-generating enzyme